MSNLSSFVSGSIKSIQRGTVSIINTANSGTAAIASVDTAKSELRFLGVSTTDGLNTPENWFTRIALTNATTVTANRTGLGNAVTVSFEVTTWN